ncbi:MAG: aldose 1-epimerase [Reinekea sp.]|jgi:aldose 1-epimerase
MDQENSMSITVEDFGQLPDGRYVRRYRLTNRRGTIASFVDYGAAWMGFQRPEDTESLVLGCDTLEALLNQTAFLGSTVGRYANRIANGQFELDGKRLQVDQNEGRHHLHGGVENFTQTLWTVEEQQDIQNGVMIRFSHNSPSGNGGFPGNVQVSVDIRLTDDDRVEFRYRASSDTKTVFGMTNHVYFNLDGRTAGSLENHEFCIPAQTVVDVDANAIPNGELVEIKNTPLDLLNWTNVDAVLSQTNDSRLLRAGGFDHCFCYPNDNVLRQVASAKSEMSNVQLTCSSNQPGLQFYSGNFLANTPYGTNENYQKYGGFCFEPGQWPDSPNQPTFPNSVLEEGEVYDSVIIYEFSPC